MRGTLPKAKTSVAHQSCRSCHRSHGLPKGNPKLLTQQGEKICLQCHTGDPAIPSLDGALHIGESQGGGSSHIEGLQPKRATPFSRKITERGRKTVIQSGCSGCHDSHGKEKGNLRATGFDFRGEPTGVKPQTTAQLCFGCHAGAEAVRLNSGEPDFGKLFSAGGASRHGIGIAAKDRLDLPSLRASTFSGKLDCISCHDNPDPSGPRGPHASRYPSLLKAPFGQEGDMGTRGKSVNDLCFTCHDQRSIEDNQSFPLHREHMVGFTASSQHQAGRAAARRDQGKMAPANPMNSTNSPVPPPQGLRSVLAGMVRAGLGEPVACATCHDPHGSRENPSLIRFDRSVVTPSSVGGVDFVKTGLRQGTCTLMCHGHDHVHSNY
ncbi:MAG: hypothetical protein IPP78_00915 [Holophagaceae bacterium]|nr:hypothetical protein [Holophagaceae bacterium]